MKQDLTKLTDRQLKTLQNQIQKEVDRRDPPFVPVGERIPKRLRDKINKLYESLSYGVCYNISVNIPASVEYKCFLDTSSMESDVFVEYANFDEPDHDDLIKSKQVQANKKKVDEQIKQLKGLVEEAAKKSGETPVDIWGILFKEESI